MRSDLRSLPTLELPAAFVRVWADSEGTEIDIEGLVADFEGVEPFGDAEGKVCGAAVVPVAGRAQVISAALRLGRAFLRAGSGQEQVLVYPGRVARGPGGVEPVRDTLADDLDVQKPSLQPGQVMITGYAAARVRDRLEMRKAGFYDPPSGRRVPLLVARGEPGRPLPLHDPDILGRRVNIPRPHLLAPLDEVLEAPAARLVGPLGVGKSHLLWHHLGPEGARWLAAGPDRLAAKSLDERVRMDTTGGLHNRWVIDVTAASAEDRAFLREQLDELGDQPPIRLLLVERQASPLWDDLPTLEVPPLDAEESKALSAKLFDGLDMSAELAERFERSAAGNPLALGQCLVRLLHRGLLRQVYGSYFYAGADDIEIEVSEQLACEVEAEVRRLGDPLPLRLLAAVDEPISAKHLLRACDRFGVELDDDWHQPLRQAGLVRWVEGSSDQLAFACPAYGIALRQTAPQDARRSFRHALGGVLAEDQAGWRAYQLLAGTPEALPSLLDVSHSGESAVGKEEVFNALWAEHREHRSRGGDAGTELEILWNLVPLAHRLGMLGRLRGELVRAVDLAGGEATGTQRYVALAALLAELDQEQGRYREAEAALRDSLAASQGLDVQRRAALIVRLGVLLTRQERFGEARAVFRDLLRVAQTNKARSLEASCHYHLGNIELLERKPDEARAAHQRAAQIRASTNQPKALGSSQVALGQVALQVGDLPTALEHFDTAEKNLDASRAESWETGAMLVGRGRALGRLGDLAGAAKALREALRILRSDDSAGEALARLTYGYILLEQEKHDEALDQARRAHFQASLLSDAALLGDAERLLGCVLLRRKGAEAAVPHFFDALRLHGKHHDCEALAEDRGWLLEVSMALDDADGVFQHAAEMRTVLDELRAPLAGESLNFRLYRALRWLQERDIAVPDPVVYLRVGYQELLRKTQYVPEQRRHHFLYQVRDHREILEAAAENDLSFSFFVKPPDAEDLSDSGDAADDV